MTGGESKVKQDGIGLWSQPAAYLQCGSRIGRVLSPEPNRTAHADV